MALTKLNNKAVANVTTLPVALGDMVLVSSATASSSASIEFSLGNLKEYKFFFVNIHPQTDGSTFKFNLSSDNGSNYNVVKTTTHFRAYHNEAGTDTSLAYSTAYDLAQSSDDHTLCNGTGGDNDQNISGYFQLFNPSSTTYVKQFIATLNQAQQSDYTIAHYVAGYANTTSALTNIKFVLPSGNIDAGKILMFGIN
jgi:hypothetical protein